MHLGGLMGSQARAGAAGGLFEIPGRRQLTQALRGHRHRWREETIAAASVWPKSDELTADEWVDLLDRIDAALAGVLPPIESVTRIRARTIK